MVVRGDREGSQICMKPQIIRAQNDNSPVQGEFESLPEEFLRVYQRELLDWARDLQNRGQFLTINPWQRPDATILSVDWQPNITLRCDLLAHPVTRKMIMRVQPDSEADVEAVRRHVEALPAIMRAHKAKAAAIRDTPKSYVSAEFLGISDYFIERYGFELREWGRNLARIGLRKHIILREGTLSDLSPNPEQGAVLLRVSLVADVERHKNGEIKLLIKPETEQDDMLIRKHCEKLQKMGIAAIAQLVEPERPWIPFVPTIDPL